MSTLYNVQYIRTLYKSLTLINEVKKPNKNIISSLKYLWTSIETKGPFGWGEIRRIKNIREKSEE